MNQSYLRCAVPGSHILTHNIFRSFSTIETNDSSKLEFLNLAGNRRIAYRKLKGERSPGIIYVPGFLSTMNGTKAMMLNSFCKENNYPFLR